MSSPILATTQIFTKYAQRNPFFYLLGVVLFPLSLLLPLSVLAGQSARVDIFIGSAICATTITTIGDISDIISYDRYSNAISFFITRPVKPHQYILGIGASTLFYNLAGMAVIFVAGSWLLDFQLSAARIAAVLVLIFLGWFNSCCVGFAIGMWGPRDHRANANLAAVVGYALTFLAPAYYPISVLPPGLQELSLTLYTTNLSLVGKSILRGEPLPGLCLVVLALYFVFNLVMLFKLARWRTR